MRYNFHTHSCFDDGKDVLENYVKAASDKGLKALGFSAHAPLNEANEWCLAKNKLASYCRKVKILKDKYREKIDIYLGLEMDYIPRTSEDFVKIFNNCALEYNIGSIHLVKNKETGELWFIDGPEENYVNGIEKIFDGNVKSAVKAFYDQSCEMVIKEKPDIIGHIDKVKMHNRGRFFSEHEKWYQDLINRLLKVIADNQTIIEVNTRGKYTGKSDGFFPSTAILEKCYINNIPVMISTDAHEPSQVIKLFDEAISLLHDIGFRETQTPFFKARID